MAWLQRVAVVASALASVLLVVSAGYLRAQIRRTRAPVGVLHLTFSRVGPETASAGFSGAVANGDYAFTVPTQPGAVGTLFDDRTGTVTAIEQPACASGATAAAALGGGWLALDCSSAATPFGLTELLNIASGSWRAARYPVAPYCDCGVVLTAVGADWIQLEQSGSGCHYVCTSTVFQNIQTGSTESDPTRARTIPDLNSPVLARRVCAPLRVPRLAPDPFGPIVTIGPQFGSLEFDGRFVIAAADFGVRLERCGSRLSEPIPTNSYQLAANARMIAWPQVTPARQDFIVQLDAILLPSRRRVRIPLPASVQQTDGITLALSSGRIYADVSSGLYAAPLPASAR